MIGKLPHKFTEKMKKLLGAEFDNFMSSYDDQRLYGLRVNRLKLEADRWRELSPFGKDTRPIPWCAEGFYYREGERPGKHPHYHAGLYYIQEPSAMAPVELLDVQPGQRVLDLCAAPGGKSTQIAAKLQGQGVLVTNDNARERTKALAKNIELAGVRNAIVLNEEPERLAPVFAQWFDRILIDAPCSGEGMFRKDESMIADWEKHSVQRCSGMQRDILRHAAAMLAPGGLLVYSTCTFSPEENEQQIADFLAEREDFEIVPVKHRFGWQPGRPELVERDWTDGEREDAAAPQASLLDHSLTAGRLQSLEGTVRLWPHRLEGEGHYAAVLRRSGEGPASEPELGQLEAPASSFSSEGTTGEFVRVSGKRERQAALAGAVVSERRTKEAARDAGRRTSDQRLSRAEKRTVSERGWKPSGRIADFNGGGQSSRSERTGRELEAPEETWLSQAAQILAGTFVAQGRLVAYGSKIYLQPHGVPSLDGLRVVRAGWYVGEADKGRLAPSHPLALGLSRKEAARSINWSADQPETLRYLKGETVFAEESELELQTGVTAKGYVLVCTDGFPIGWAKFAGGMLKNELPTGWRWM